jgi:hypothetical protein
LFFILQALKPIANRKDSLWFVVYNLWFFTLQASKPITRRKSVWFSTAVNYK